VVWFGLASGCCWSPLHFCVAVTARLALAIPQEAAVLLRNYRQLMKNVLEDARLVRLQLEGGALLARLRKEESCVTLTQDYR